MIADLNTLYDGFRSSMKGSSWKEEPQRFEIDILSELVRLKHETEDETYRTSDPVEFTLNERGKMRYIHGGRMRDRVVRHALCDTELGPKLEKYLIYNNGASQKGKGLSFARAQFEKDLHNFWLKYRTNDGYIGFVDLSKFYDNIQHEKIREAVYPHIPEEARRLMDETLRGFRVDVTYMSDEEYAECMETKFNSVDYFSKYPKEVRKEWKQPRKYMAKSVEIGDQVSQNIGIFFPTPIDNYVKIVRGQKWYGRYMDDMYVICKTREEVRSILDGIAEQARKIGLYINEKKTHIVRLSDTYKFLQIKYSLTETGKVIKRINPVNVTRERRKLKAYKRLMDRGAMTYEDIEQAARSWMGNYVKLMSKDQIKHMKTLYKELFGRELKWKRQS